MKEYIEKEKLFDCLDIKNALGGHYGISLTAINAIPAADVVEQKHGEWVIIEDLFGEICHCSECGFFMGVNEPGNGLPDVESLKYCPNCGAKMNGGENDG